MKHDKRLKRKVKADGSDLLVNGKRVEKLGKKARLGNEAVALFKKGKLDDDAKAKLIKKAQDEGQVD